MPASGALLVINGRGDRLFEPHPSLSTRAERYGSDNNNSSTNARARCSNAICRDPILLSLGASLKRRRRRPRGLPSTRRRYQRSSIIPRATPSQCLRPSPFAASKDAGRPLCGSADWKHLKAMPFYQRCDSLHLSIGELRHNPSGLRNRRFAETLNYLGLGTFTFRC